MEISRHSSKQSSFGMKFEVTARLAGKKGDFPLFKI